MLCCDNIFDTTFTLCITSNLVVVALYITVILGKRGFRNCLSRDVTIGNHVHQNY